MTVSCTPFAQTFFHGAKTDLGVGDLIRPGFASNHGDRATAAFVYLTATLDAAIWGAELAAGDGPPTIYVVEPVGPVEDDPNLTDKKFAGNPTRSYRTRDPLRILGRVAGWHGHSDEQIKAMKEGLARLKALGADTIEG
jgi:rifampin ADP-ribosylating transferase